MKTGLALRAERRQDVTQIDCILTIPVEIGTRREPRRGHTVDHRSVAQYGQIETVAVEGHETRTQLHDLVAEGGDQLLLCPLPTWGAPMASTAQWSGSQCAIRAPMQTIE